MTLRRAQPLVPEFSRFGGVALQATADGGERRTGDLVLLVLSPSPTLDVVLIRRKRVPDDLAPSLRGLRAVVVEVEAAKAAMIATVPSTRLPGTPLPDALLALDEHLRRARDLLPVWRHLQVEDEWQACGEGIDEALRRAAELREQAPDLGGFEGLIWAVDQLLEPLEAFEAAAERFRTLRR